MCKTAPQIAYLLSYTRRAVNRSYPVAVEKDQVVGLKMKMAKEEWAYRLAGVVSGVLLMAGNLYPSLALLQIAAFIPVLYLAAVQQKRDSYMLLAGLYSGLAYTLPQVFILRLPVVMTLILLLQTTVEMSIFAWVSAKLLRGTSAVWGALAVGAFLVVIDWLDFTLVPIWGTAQSLARPWSYYPTLVAFVSFTGITGIIFLLGTLQALAVKFIILPKMRLRISLTAIILFLIFAGADLATILAKPLGTLKVAAIGWTDYDATEAGEVYSKKGFDTLFVKPVAAAAQQGAKIIVTPELGFQFTDKDRQEWLDKIGQVAKRYNVFLAIGYCNNSANENRLLFMNPQGQVLSEYTKTYLTVFESFRKGNGQLKTINVDGFKVGGMICQDDNFTSLSRRYGREKTGIVAVPTLDWRQVREAHLQSNIHRALESHYAIIRAALNGISAIISPDGKILAKKDHFAQGSGVIIAEVPVYSEETLFSLAGHWPVVVGGMFLTFYLFCNIKPWV